MKKLLLIVLFAMLPGITSAQERFEGQITTVTPQGEGYEVTVRPQTGQPFEATLDPSYLPGNTPIMANQAYVFEQTDTGEVHVLDIVRRPALLILFALFLVVTVLVAGWKGIRSLLGMALSFAVMIGALLPALLQGANPIIATILAALVLVPINFFLSHGWNRKTIAAAIGTIAALLLTGCMATWFSDLAFLTGFTSEEITFLQMYFPEGIQAKGLLLAGMIIGLLGILDDVTITQAAVTLKLKDANPNYTKRELIQKSLDVGKDHIASVVNTLVLVYVGSALPLLLLFMNDAIPFAQVLNSEMVAEEIVRTLVGSIGLILAVPFTSVLAAVFMSPSNTPQQKHNEFDCSEIHAH